MSHTLARKFDAVHINTTHSSRMMPNVCRAKPWAFLVGPCDALASLDVAPLVSMVDAVVNNVQLLS